jgi:hypothetical protein
MSIELQSVQQIRAFSEATFGADSSASIASFTSLPIIEGSATLALVEDELDPGQLVQYRLEGRKRVLGKRSATLNFQLNIAPTGVAANTSTSSVTSGLGLILKAIMGGEALANGSTSSTGSTAVIVNVASGHGSRWAAGKAMGWANSAGIVEWREVESVSTDAVTLKRGFSGAPANGNALYNAATYYMTASPAESLAFMVNGLDPEDVWLLTGGQAVGGMNIALDLTGGQLPRVTVNMQFADWYSFDEMSDPPVIATATYSNYNPIVGEAGRFEVWTVAAPTFSTTQTVHCSALGFEPHIGFVPYTSPSGINTIKQWIAARNTDSPVQGTWTEPFEVGTWWNVRDALTDKAAQYVAGVAAGSALIFSCPTIQILNPQRAADASGIAAQTIQFKGRRDTDVAASTTDLAKSPLRIHLG